MRVKFLPCSLHTLEHLTAVHPSQEQEVTSAQTYEPEEVPAHAANSIDLAFVVDVTGSMARALLARSRGV